MKIGDNVRFLNDVGGGKIAGFKGKNIVLVEDEDGFQIPTSISDVVVVETDDYGSAKSSMGKPSTKQKQAKKEKNSDGVSKSYSAIMREAQEEPDDLTDEDLIDDTREVTFRPAPVEREGGNKLSAYLAFVATADRQSADPRFEAYLVNDSNYYMHYVCASLNEGKWLLMADGEIEPNTKQSVGLLSREEIAGLDRVNIMLTPYKRKVAFELKPAVDLTLRIDPVKFFKANTFRPNLFFNTPALVYTIIEDDQPAQPQAIDPERIKEQMVGGAKRSETPDAPASSARRDALVRRYADDQRKGARKNSPLMRRRDIDDAVVVDLHASEILETTRGMQAGEILEYQLKVFRDTLGELAQKKGQRVVFIHGKGEGVLRRAIIDELNRKYKTYTHQDASFQEYGYGATMVIIR